MLNKSKKISFVETASWECYNPYFWGDNWVINIIRRWYYEVFESYYSRALILKSNELGNKSGQKWTKFVASYIHNFT